MSNPLMVIASRTPAQVPEYELVRVQSPAGIYATNADLTVHHNPFDGKEVSFSRVRKGYQSESADIKVKKFENPVHSTKEYMGVKCPGKKCDAIVAMPILNVLERPENYLHCVVCGTSVAYDIKNVKIPKHLKGKIIADTGEENTVAKSVKKVKDGKKEKTVKGKDGKKTVKQFTPAWIAARMRTHGGCQVPVEHMMEMHDEDTDDMMPYTDGSWKMSAGGKAVSFADLEGLQAGTVIDIGQGNEAASIEEIGKLIQEVKSNGQGSIPLALLNTALSSKDKAARKFLKPIRKGNYALACDGAFIGFEELSNFKRAGDYTVTVYATDAKDKGKKKETAGVADLNADTWDLVNMVPENAALSFQTIGQSRYGAFLNDVLVASMEDEQDLHAHVTTASFREGFQDVVRQEGVAKALQSAGFDLISVQGQDVLTQQVDQAKAEVAGNVQSLVDKKMQRIKWCMDIAASGGIVGMFRKEGMDVLAKKLVDELHSRGVEDAGEIAHAILPRIQSTYCENLIATAISLSEDSNASLNTLTKQIQDMEPTTAKVVRLDDRLIAGGRKVKPAKTAKANDNRRNQQQEAASVIGSNGRALSVGGIFQGVGI